jgi:hypothetical protein
MHRQVDRPPEQILPGPGPVRPARLAAYSVDPRRVLWSILAIELALVAAGSAALVVFYSSDSLATQNICRLFMLDRERNLPTFFSFLLLLLSGHLALNIGREQLVTGDRWRWHWLGLAVALVLMAFDEAAEVHEELIPIVQPMVPHEGPLYFAWVVPGMALALTAGVVYARFLWAMPARLSMLFLAAGGFYFGGALGMEMVSGAYAARNGIDSLTFEFISTVEESLEMLGLAILVYAILQFQTFLWDAPRL